MSTGRAQRPNLCTVARRCARWREGVHGGVYSPRSRNARGPRVRARSDARVVANGARIRTATRYSTSPTCQTYGLGAATFLRHRRAVRERWSWSTWRTRSAAASDIRRRGGARGLLRSICATLDEDAVVVWTVLRARSSRRSGRCGSVEWSPAGMACCRRARKRATLDVATMARPLIGTRRDVMFRNEHHVVDDPAHCGRGARGRSRE